MKNITLPYVRIGLIKDFIKKFPQEDVCELDDIYDLFGKSKISNLLPALQLLELVDYDKKLKTLKLSDLGLKFRIAIITNDDDLAGKLIKSGIEEKEPFKFVSNLLITKNILTSEEIGKQLAFKFSKRWDNPLTFKAYGSAIASILSYVGDGIYSRGILRLDGQKIKLKKKPVLPSCSFNTIFKIVEYISKIKEVDLSTLINDLGKRVSTEIGVCIELELIEKIAPKQYYITEKGYRLVESFNREHIPEIWRQTLFESEYRELIIKLQEKEITTLDLGNFLNRYIGGKWSSELTIKTYGKKFMSWLREANLIETISKGKYRVIKVNNFLKKETKLKSELSKEGILNSEEKAHFYETEDNKNTVRIQENSSNGFQLIKANIGYFRLGKQIGIITSSSKGDFEKTINAVKELIQLCEKYEYLKDFNILIKDHLQLYKEIKDNRLFFSDIKLLERKLGFDL